LGIGNWELRIRPNPQSPIPNPQSPKLRRIINLKILNFKLLKINLNNKNELYKF